jgi:hypothetical protein
MTNNKLHYHLIPIAIISVAAFIIITEFGFVTGVLQNKSGSPISTSEATSALFVSAPRLSFGSKAATDIDGASVAPTQPNINMSMNVAGNISDGAKLRNEMSALFIYLVNESGLNKNIK